jgi:endoglucanase
MASSHQNHDHVHGAHGSSISTATSVDATHQDAASATTDVAAAGASTTDSPITDAAPADASTASVVTSDAAAPELSTTQSGSAPDAPAAAPDAAPATGGHGMMLGVNIAGGEFGGVGDEYGHGYIYPSHDQIDYYASKGMDVIRVPFDWERVQHQKFGALDSAEMSRLDDVVGYAGSKGMHVDLDMHGYGSGFGALVGTEQTSSDAFADAWGKIAGHYAGAGHVMFGLMNEPHDQSAADWLGSVNSAVSAIRSAGAHDQTILVPGTHWDGAWTWTTTDNANVIGNGVNDPDHHVAFEVHQYFDDGSTGTTTQVVSDTIGAERLSAITTWAEQTHSKLFLGEFGAGSDAKSMAALDNTLSYMGQHQDAWLGATYWAGGAWWGDYAFSVEPHDGHDAAQMGVLQHHAELLA